MAFVDYFFIISCTHILQWVSCFMQIKHSTYHITQIILSKVFGYVYYIIYFCSWLKINQTETHTYETKHITSTSAPNTKPPKSKLCQIRISHFYYIFVMFYLPRVRAGAEFLTVGSFAALKLSESNYQIWSPFFRASRPLFQTGQSLFLRAPKLWGVLQGFCGPIFIVASVSGGIYFLCRHYWLISRL